MPPSGEAMGSAELYLNLLLVCTGCFAALACFALLLYLVFLWRECRPLSRNGRKPVLAPRKESRVAPSSYDPEGKCGGAWINVPTRVGNDAPTQIAFSRDSGSQAMKIRPAKMASTTMNSP